MLPVGLVFPHSNTRAQTELSWGGVGLKGMGSRQQLKKQQMMPSSCQVHPHLATLS